MHSPEVELNEIFVSNIFSGNDITRAGPQFPNFDKKKKIGCIKDLTLRTSFSVAIVT